MNKDTYNNLKILSSYLATDKSAPLHIVGGAHIGKNLYVNDDIVAKEIIIKNNLKIGKNLYIDHGIIPINQTNSEIGKKDTRFNKIYGFYIDSIKTKSRKGEFNDLDVVGDISLGTNCKKEPLLKIDPKIENTIIINSNLVINNGFICINPQYENITSSVESIDIKSSLIILSTNCSKNVNLVYNKLPINSNIKIIIKKMSTLNNNGLVLNINKDESIIFRSVNEYINILYDGGKLLYIGGDAELL